MLSTHCHDKHQTRARLLRRVRNENTAVHMRRFAVMGAMQHHSQALNNGVGGSFMHTHKNMTRLSFKKWRHTALWFCFC